MVCMLRYTFEIITEHILTDVFITHRMGRNVWIFFSGKMSDSVIIIPVHQTMKCSTFSDTRSFPACQMIFVDYEVFCRLLLVWNGRVDNIEVGGFWLNGFSLFLPLFAWIFWFLTVFSPSISFNTSISPPF